MRLAQLFVLLILLGPLGAQEPPVTPTPTMPEDKDPITTPSGLKVSVFERGEDGPRPKLGDTVTVHYTGWLEDGTIFDSSVQRGEPLVIKVGQVIEGWNEGLSHLGKGGRAKLTIPSEIGYGVRGSPPKIPPNATLIFEVELIDYKPGPPLPEFHKAIPEAQKTTASGLKFEVLKEGNGENAKPNEVVTFRYALWNEAGKLLDATELNNQRPRGSAEQMGLPFLKEALPLLNEGARYWFLVPPALAGDHMQNLPPKSTTIWEIEIERIARPLPVPEFVMPSEDELQKTASGLQYQVVKEGRGKPVSKGAKIETHYAGWLTNGTPFDNSYARGAPFEVPVGAGRVIKGWDEGLQLMKEGAVYRFVIPAGLAYAERGSPPTIPPNSTLVFQIEVLTVTE